MQAYSSTFGRINEDSFLGTTKHGLREIETRRAIVDNDEAAMYATKRKNCEGIYGIHISAELGYLYPSYTRK